MFIKPYVVESEFDLKTLNSATLPVAFPKVKVEPGETVPIPTLPDSFKVSTSNSDEPEVLLNPKIPD